MPRMKDKENIKILEDISKCFSLDIDEEYKTKTIYPGKWKSTFYNHKPKDKTFSVLFEQQELCLMIEIYNINIKRIY